MLNKKIMAFAITFAMIGAGFSIIGLNVVMAEDSGRLFEELNNGYSPVKKIAWDGSGDFALAVTGTNDTIYKYTRSTTSWSAEYAVGVGATLNDIIYDDFSDQFFMVGNATGDPIVPVAYSYTTAGGLVSYGSPSLTYGTFNGLVMAHEYGSTPFKLLAVGQTDTGDALAKWLDNTNIWVDADVSGFNTGDILYDVTMDFYTPATYFVVGENLGQGIMYSWSAAGATLVSPVIIPFTTSILNTIDWNPDMGPSGTGTYNYSIVGGYDNPNGNLFKFNGISLKVLDNQTGYNIEDFDWSPDGTWGTAVGWQSTQGIIYNYYTTAGTLGTLKDLSYKLPTGTQPFYGVSVKGYTSPSSAIIAGASSGLGVYVSSTDSGTKIQVNTDVPHGYAPAMWDMTDAGMTSTLDAQVDVTDETYTFRGFFNYSIGANDQFFDGKDNIIVNLTGWYDDGIETTSPVVGAGDGNRTRQFSAEWFENDTASMTYPAGAPNEFELNSWGYETVVAGQTYYVYLNVTFHKQTYAASGGFTTTPVGSEWDPTIQLNDINSWNFRFEIYDANFTSANNYTYGEFGVFKYTNVTVVGNPSASAPPGTKNVLLSPFSNITCVANTEWLLNVSIPDLVDGTNSIPATNVSLKHANVTGQANNTNTEILNETYMPGANVEVGIWGNATATQMLPAPLNGTTCNGPMGSNYNAYGGTTQVMWWIDVPAGTAEGQYEAIITFTIGYN